MADEFAVAHDKLDAFAAQQGHAVREHGDAVGGVGVAAAVVEQLPVKRHVDLARAGRDEQAVDLAVAKVPLRAVQAQA
jgi:chromosome condensin MukBEF complex kleisin-like MukF subunit